MKILQEALNSAIEDIPQAFLADMLREKLATQGVRLSRRQCKKLARQAINEELEFFDLPWWRFWQYHRFRKPKDLLIEFTSEDAEELGDALENFIDKSVPEIIKRIIEEQPENILITLRSRWNSEFKKQLRDERKFRRRLLSRWGEPIQQLQVLLTIVHEFGFEINRDLRHPELEENKHLINVLTRLHARACQITGEIECLLSNGFSDGAMARWRDGEACMRLQ